MMSMSMSMCRGASTIVLGLLTGLVCTACPTVPNPALTELTLSLSIPSSRTELQLDWGEWAEADEYTVYERLRGDDDERSTLATLSGTSWVIEVPPYLRFNASYVVEGCGNKSCRESETLHVSDLLVEQVTKNSQQFGQSVAISETTLAVGASGVVVIYERTDDGWVESLLLTPGGESEFFGEAVALSGNGNRLAVGASGTHELPGVVYVWQRTDTGWTTEPSCTAAPVQDTLHFGRALAMSLQDTLAVGASGTNDGAGAVYVCDTSSCECDLVDEGEDSLDAFGSDVALSEDGSTLAVGAPGADGRAGAVYVYEGGAGLWLTQTTVDPGPLREEDWFGHSVALSTDATVLAVGAPGVDFEQDNTGAVYLFTSTNGEWEPLTAPVTNLDGPDVDAWVGSEVALALRNLDDDDDDETILVVGAPRSFDSQAPGAVYIYALDGGDWSLQSRIEAELGFGSTLGLLPDGSSLAVGTSGSGQVVHLY